MWRKLARSFMLALPLQLITVQAFAQDAAKLVANSGHDASVIQGVNSAGTVRVNNLACLEAVLNLGANGFEIMGILIGVFMLVSTIKTMPGKKRIVAICVSFLPIALGLLAPSAINWAVASARDANLFS